MMEKNSFLKDLSIRLSSALPTSVRNLKNDIDQNFQTILQKAFSKLELVTRNEFDSQSRVLVRTRKKLEALEKEVKELEGIVHKKGSARKK